MIDHLELKTRQLDAALAFYAIVLEPLGYALKTDGASKGFGDGKSLDFFVGEGEPTRAIHFAFAASNRATVDRVYRRAGEAGLTLDRAPALAPHIHPNYYAGYLRDPDGHLIEFVTHRAE
ncbi:VOC family protein [Sphingomonas sp.]|uniref:VOC family protein n=1 Tax=Sphingomonas sp. TaxID=28214 RepID=UPI001B13F712|nr:VOC family protein [Sphingomonas sp.]MBO9713752.1 VOC family protein [Sphingomonas sp.]